MAGRRAPWCGWRASRTRARTLDNAVARFAGSGMNLCTRRHDLHLQDSKMKFVEHVVSQGTGIHMIYRIIDELREAIEAASSRTGARRAPRLLELA